MVHSWLHVPARHAFSRSVCHALGIQKSKVFLLRHIACPSVVSSQLLMTIGNLQSARGLCKKLGFKPENAPAETCYILLACKPAVRLLLATLITDVFGFHYAPCTATYSQTALQPEFAADCKHTMVVVRHSWPNMHRL